MEMMCICFHVRMAPFASAYNTFEPFCGVKSNIKKKTHREFKVCVLNVWNGAAFISYISKLNCEIAWMKKQMKRREKGVRFQAGMKNTFHSDLWAGYVSCGYYRIHVIQLHIPNRYNIKFALRFRAKKKFPASYLKCSLFCCCCCYNFYWLLERYFLWLFRRKVYPYSWQKFFFIQLYELIIGFFHV